MNPDHKARKDPSDNANLDFQAADPALAGHSRASKLQAGSADLYPNRSG